MVVTAEDPEGASATVAVTVSLTDVALGTLFSGVPAALAQTPPAVGASASQTGLTVAEGGSGTYTVYLSSQPTGNVTVRPSSDNTAVATVSGPLIITPDNWRVQQTVTVTGVEDSIANNPDGQRTATITHTATGGGYTPATMTESVTVTVTDNDAVDYDLDDDNLIEVGNLPQIHAMRWDLDGNGAASTGNEAAYAAAFPDAPTGMGCAGTCAGYELTADLDFDTDGSGTANNGDTYWNGGAGWEPLGDSTTAYIAKFNGNGHVISNLFINRTTSMNGLFGEIAAFADIRNVGLVHVDVTGDATLGQQTGALVGSASGDTTKVSSSYATGKVNGASSTGGLVGRNLGLIIAAWADVAVMGNSAGSSGGLVGYNGSTGSITASYALGTAFGVQGGSNGLVGRQHQNGVVNDSYYLIPGTSETAQGKTRSTLQGTLSYTGIYADWNVDLDGEGKPDDPWDFGTETEYPKLELREAGIDYTLPVVSISGKAVREGTSADFRLTASRAVDYDLYVLVRVFTGGDFGWAPATSGYHTFRLPAGRTQTRLRFATHGDAVAEPDGSITVSVTPLHASYRTAPSPDNRATVIIRDDDALPAPPVAPGEWVTYPAFVGLNGYVPGDVFDDTYKVSTPGPLGGSYYRPYQWRWAQLSGPAVDLSQDSYTAYFRLPDLPYGTLLKFRVTATQNPEGLARAGQDTSSPATKSHDLLLRVDNPGNGRPPAHPVADAGPDRTAATGQSITLDGVNSSSPTESWHDLDYSWQLTSAPGNVLNSYTPWTAALDMLEFADTHRPTLVMPELYAGEALRFKLTVSIWGRTHTDTVLVKPAAPEVPVAEAGPDQEQAPGRRVVLQGGNGGNFYGEGARMEYGWAQLSDPAVALSGERTVNPWFVLPENAPVGRALRFEMTVTDLEGQTASTTVTVTVVEPIPPTANAGPDQEAPSGATVTLRGAGSVNPYGEPADLNYLWTQISGFSVTLSGDTLAEPSFTMPSAAEGAALEFLLTVTGREGESDSDTVTVTVAAPVIRPTACAGPDLAGTPGGQVILEGRCSTNPYGAWYQMTHAWAQLSGPAVTVSDATVGNPSFTVPADAADGTTLEFRLTVTDREGESDSDTMTVTVDASLPDTRVDYDVDGDNLIEVANLAQLHAIFHDLNGDGQPDPTDAGEFHTAYANPLPGLGCEATCAGYEMVDNLDFDTNGNGRADAGDAYWNNGSGWLPIGGGGVGYSGEFNGNGHTISNLYLNRSGADYGLFGRLGGRGYIHHVGLLNVSVTNTQRAAVAGGGDTGALVGEVMSGDALVAASFATGSVSGGWQTGGLVGDNEGRIVASWTNVAVSGGNKVGGIAGDNTGTVIASYAIGSVHSDSTQYVDGVAGYSHDGGSVRDSYFNTGAYASASAGGRSAAQLRAPVDYAGIYANWNVDLNRDTGADDPWDFGNGGHYPLLKADSDGDGAASWEEFSGQTRSVVAPTATAGPDLTGAPGESVTLQGRGSTNPYGKWWLMEHRWTQLSGPTVTLSDATVADPTFTVPADATNGTTLEFQLTVTDKEGQSDSDTMIVTVGAPEAVRPTANAGPDLTGAPGGSVTLQGKGSANPYGKWWRMAHQWTQLSGPSVTLDEPTHGDPTFTIPADAAGGTTLEFELTVTDKEGESDSDTMTVTVSGTEPEPPPGPENTPPTAAINAAQVATATAGEIVALQGAGNDAETAAESLTCAWSQVGGTPSVSIANAGAAAASFTAPDVTEEMPLTFRLTVTDEGGLSASAETTIAISPEPEPENSAPTAAIDAAQVNTAVTGETVHLQGVGNDAETAAESLTFAWSQAAGTPTVSIANADTATASFTAPDVTEETALTFRLTVTDADGLSATAETTVTVSLPPEPENTPPTFDEGPARNGTCRRTAQRGRMWAHRSRQRTRTATP